MNNQRQNLTKLFDKDIKKKSGSQWIRVSQKILEYLQRMKIPLGSLTVADLDYDVKCYLKDLVDAIMEDPDFIDDEDQETEAEETEDDE